MSSAPQTQDDDAERGADRQADAMTVQLRKDVDSWSRARRDSSPGYIAESSLPVPRQPSSQPLTRSRKPNAATPAVKQTGTRSKPVGMSYDGMTTSEYIQYMIDRGAR
jgi:hypothetical protein